MKPMRKVFLRMRLILFIFITICVIASNVTADNVTYTYDDAGRLTKANYGSGNIITYTYDKAGNMLEKKVVTDAATDPVPDVKANGSDGTVTPTGNLSVTVAVDPGSLSGDSVDWWVVASTPFGWFHYDLPSGSWIPGLIVTFQGSLFNLTPPYTVLSMSGLPPGIYTFYFGVDMVMNGSLDMGSIYYDSVVVNINP